MYWKVSKISAPTLWRSHEVSTWVWIWKKCLSVQHFLFVSPSYHFFAHKLTLSSPSLSLFLLQNSTHSPTHSHTLSHSHTRTQIYFTLLLQPLAISLAMLCLRDCRNSFSWWVPSLHERARVCVCVHACMREKERGRRSHSGVHVNASERSPDWRHQFQLTIPYWLE